MCNQKFIPSEAVLQHATELSVIGCMDFRLQDARRDFVRSRYGVTFFDQIILPGSCKRLIEKGDAQTILGVDVSCDLHHVKRIVIFHHTDCGAYGGSSTFSDHATEMSIQGEQVLSAAQTITDHFRQTGHDVPIIDLFLEVIDEAQGGVTYLEINK